MPDTLADRIAAMIAAEKLPPPPEPKPAPLAYTYQGAADATGLSLRTITREVKAGRIKTTKARGRVLITEAELQRYLAANARS